MSTLTEVKFAKSLNDSLEKLHSPLQEQSWRDGNHNLGKNICGIFHVLTKFAFTTKKTEEHYYHQRVNISVASQVAE